jgi:hypothetical protein
MTITDRDASILAQVAFKAAAELSSGDVLTSEGNAAFDATLVLLTEKLFATVEAAQSAYKTSVPTPAPYNPEAAIANELGGTPHFDVVSEGGAQGPIPAWATKAMQAAGVTRIYDNRAKLGENPNLPWFKCADTKKPFWPPKGGKK